MHMQIPARSTRRLKIVFQFGGGGGKMYSCDCKPDLIKIKSGMQGCVSDPKNVFLGLYVFCSEQSRVWPS